MSFSQRANSVICGVFLSNNSYRMQMYTNKADEKKNIVFFFMAL